MFKLIVVVAASLHLIPAVAAFPQLLARQSSNGGLLSPGNVPAQCSDGCTAISNTINACADDTCVCTNGNFAALASCLDCVTFFVQGTQSQAQSAIDQIISDCNSEGFTVNPVTITPASVAGGPTGSSTGSPTNSTSGGASATVSGTTTSSSRSTITPTTTSPSGLGATIPVTNTNTPNTPASSPSTSPAATNGVSGMYAQLSLASLVGVAGAVVALL